MGNITIKRTIEIPVDLNSYYEQFPRKLQGEIADAVLALARGVPRTRPAHPTSARGLGGTSTFLAPGKHGRYGLQARIGATILRRFPNGMHFSYGELTDIVKDEAKAMDKLLQTNPVSVIGNMYRQGYIKLVD